MPDSARIPATFRPPAYTSFGHLRFVVNPVASRIPSATLTPAAIVTSGAIAADGRRIVDTYNPAPGGEDHALPCRPRPAVCRSAPTTVPSAAPRSARRSATSFVDPISEYQ